jgi:glutamine---fructose-6-phosphate transaminase (isomerizing)
MVAATGNPPKFPWNSFDQAFHSQPEALARLAATLPGELERHGGSDPHRLVVFGIGASHAAAHVLVAGLLARGVPCELRTGADFTEAQVRPGTTYLGISQSGRSVEIVRALSAAPEESRMSVVNRTPSPVAGLTARTLSLGGVADSRVSTVGYTATALALAMLAEHLTGGLDERRWGTFGDRLAGVIGDHREAAGRIAADVLAAGHLDLISSGAGTAAAEGGSLLFREGVGLPAAAFDTRSYLHGFMDSARPGSVHLIVDNGIEALLARQLADHGATVYLLGTGPIEYGGAGPLHQVHLPGLTAAELSIAAAVVCQMVVRDACAAIGRRPEDPVFTRLDTKVETVA